MTHRVLLLCLFWSWLWNTSTVDWKWVVPPQRHLRKQIPSLNIPHTPPVSPTDHKHAEKWHKVFYYPLGVKPTLTPGATTVCLCLQGESNGGPCSYLRVWLWLLVIWGLLLGLENVINQLSDPTKGKPPVQMRKVGLETSQSSHHGEKTICLERVFFFFSFLENRAVCTKWTTAGTFTATSAEREGRGAGQVGE